MKRSYTILTIAAVLFVVSWLTPVVRGGTTLAQGGLPGWEAMRLGLSPIWSYEGLGGWAGLGGLIGVVSALTNVWFLAAFAILLRGVSKGGRTGFWIIVVATAVNGLWFVLADKRGGLYAGYYLWLLAFVTLSVAARSRFTQMGPAPVFLDGR